jgi:D-alanyl-D-alanine carboxypeptidase (penicillin-binding protein 5/6)
MTFYTVYQLAIEGNLSLSKEGVLVDEEASEMSGTSASLLPGDRVSVEQLLYGLMLPSGNDAAVCLAKWGGNLINSHPSHLTPLSSFICRMNKYAKLLGLKSSSFGNPHGLPNYRNTSNPYDLSLLIAQCMKISLFCRIVGTQLYKLTISNESGLTGRREVVWQNTNKLLRRKGFIGVKTGVTVTAGPCLASCY